MTDVQTTEDRISVELHIAAPPESVFDALTDPDQMVEWWGDDEAYRTEEAQVELREGGRWRAAGRNADGGRFTVSGEYLEVERPRLLRYSWEPSWAEWDLDEPTVVTVTLEAEDGGTRLTLLHEGFAGHEKERREHAEGWPWVLELLQAYVR